MTKLIFRKSECGIQYSPATNLLFKQYIYRTYFLVVEKQLYLEEMCYCFNIVLSVSS